MLKLGPTSEIISIVKISSDNDVRFPSDDKTTSTTQQHTSGSTTSNINTFGVNVNVGGFGDLPVGGVGVSYTHSWENSHSKSDTTGSGSDVDQGTSAAASMTVKDWSACSSLSEDHTSLTWYWGQTYPWDVILYNQIDSDGNIKLPHFVHDRLFSDTDGLLLPHSELSLFGLDFTTHASWIVDFPEGVQEDEEIDFKHFTSLYTATHLIGSDKKFSAQLQSNDKASAAKFSPGALNLSEYSIAPISEGTASIGFKIDPFTCAPKVHTDTFKVVSPVNNLQVVGTGFDSIMQTSFQSKPTMDISFKIDNFSQDYSLILVHWLEEKSGACKLTWTINSKHVGSLIVDSLASSEGHNNTSIIPLRQLDYASVNLQDYLVMGYNTIHLELEQLDAKTPSVYTMSSIVVR